MNPKSGNGFLVRILGSSTDARPLADALANSLKTLGVVATLLSEPGADALGTLRAQVEQGAAVLAWGSWLSALPDLLPVPGIAVVLAGTSFSGRSDLVLTASSSKEQAVADMIRLLQERQLLQSKTASAYSTAEEEQIVQRLSDLGYI